jgi:hypothetical protein
VVATRKPLATADTTTARMARIPMIVSVVQSCGVMPSSMPF